MKQRRSIIWRVAVLLLTLSVSGIGHSIAQARYAAHNLAASNRIRVHHFRSWQGSGTDTINGPAGTWLFFARGADGSNGVGTRAGLGGSGGALRGMIHFASDTTFHVGTRNGGGGGGTGTPRGGPGGAGLHIMHGQNVTLAGPCASMVPRTGVTTNILVVAGGGGGGGGNDTGHHAWGPAHGGPAGAAAVHGGQNGGGGFFNGSSGTSGPHNSINPPDVAVAPANHVMHGGGGAAFITGTPPLNDSRGGGGGNDPGSGANGQVGYWFVHNRGNIGGNAANPSWAGGGGAGIWGGGGGGQNTGGQRPNGGGGGGASFIHTGSSAVPAAMTRYDNLFNDALEWFNAEADRLQGLAGTSYLLVWLGPGNYTT